jgi:hypothetical protein
MLAKLEVKEGSPAQGGADNDVSSMTSVAAVRSSPRHEFLPPEADATAAAVAGFDIDLCLVDEFHAVSYAFICGGADGRGLDRVAAEGVRKCAILLFD